MQELLGRIAALDPEASLGLRVIACFDELVVGNVNTRGLLAAAASLTGCTAGFAQASPPRLLRVSERGEVVDGARPPLLATTPAADGLEVWIERDGAPHSNDAIVLERLALATAIRHGHARHGQRPRRDLGVVLDADATLAERVESAARLGLDPRTRHRVVAAPLFAVWSSHPAGVEDVLPSAHGPLHVLVVAANVRAVAASPSGLGIPTTLDHLDHSLRTALVALRLSSPQSPSVDAEEYGGLVSLLADMPVDSHLPDVDLLDDVMTHAWAPATLDALVRAGSVREAARLVGVHHSTLQTRLDLVCERLGFDPLDGLGRSRLGVAYLVWRMRHSRALDLPAPGS